MPHVGDTVDSQSSCYGIQRPQAATVVPTNAEAKLVSEKTAQSSLQLQVVTGKSKLSSGTSALKQTQSERNKDTSSPISSDALNSVCAGPTHSYAAVLRGNIQVEHHSGGEQSSRPTSAPDRRRASSRQTVASSPTRGTTNRSGEPSQTGHKMGNQNSAGAAGERSRTPMLGRRKNSTQGLFRTPSASVPVTPAGTPASIRSEKVGFFRKFRRNKNRSRSGSMASINSLSSCASTVSHNLPGRGYDDSTSRDSQSSLATNSSLGGEVVLDLPSTAPSVPTTTNANVAAPAHHNAFRPQTTMLQPIREKPNEMYSARVKNPPANTDIQNEAHLVGKLPDHIKDVGHGVLRHSEGTTGSNLTLTDDGSEYLTASEPDVSRDSVNNNPVRIEGFNCDDYKVTHGTHSDGIACDDIRNSPVFYSADNNRQGPHPGYATIDSGKTVANEVASQFSRSDHKQDPVRSSASTKRKKFDKRAASKGKSDKSQSKTYAAVLGTGLFMASLDDSTSNMSRAERMDLDEGNEQISVASKNSPSSPSAAAAPVSQTASSKTETPSTPTTPTFSRSFAEVVNTPPTTKRIIHPPRGPFGSLTRKDSSSSANDKLSDSDQTLQGTPGLHGKLPKAAARQGIRTSQQKSAVVEPTIKVQHVNVANQQPPSTQGSGAYKNIRPKTFATAGNQGSGKGQIGVKTVPGGNAGSPATTPDGPGGVTCHSLPRSTLSSAGSAPALGVCGARLRAAKAHSVQQLNASKSPPLSPVKPPENTPFSDTLPSSQTKSMSQLPGKMVVSRDDISLGIKVKSEGNVKGRYESSSLPRPSKRNKAAVMPKLLTETQPGKFAGTQISDLKLNNVLDMRTDALLSKGKPVSIPLKALIINEPGDKMSGERTDMSVRREVEGSVAQKRAAENTGSLHTYPQHKVATKSDSKPAKQDQIPVTHPLQQSRKPDPGTDSHVRAEMSRVPVVAQKGGPPGMKVADADAVTQGKIQDQCSSDQHTNEVLGVKTARESANKVPVSSPSQQQSVADKEQLSESVSDQPETKQRNENANTLLNKVTEPDTSELRVGVVDVHTRGDVLEKPSRDEAFALHGERVSSAGWSQKPGEANLIVATPGLNLDSDSEERQTGISSPGEISKTGHVEKDEASAVSTTGNSKQADKSERIPERDIVSSSTRTVGAPANVIANQPAPEPRNLITADKAQDQERLLANDPNEEVSFVTGSEPSGSNPRLSIEHIECEHHKNNSHRVEKVQAEHLTVSVKFKEDTRQGVSDICSAADDIPQTENRETVPEMGSGESKHTEDSAKKVTVSKLPVKKKDAQKKSKGDHDERAQDETKLSGPSKEKEAEGTGLAAGTLTAQVGREAMAPRPPPRTHKATNVKPSQPQATQEEEKDAETFSKSRGEDSSSEKNCTPDKRRIHTEAEDEQSVATNNKKRINSDRSGFPLEPAVRSPDEKVSDKTEANVKSVRTNVELSQQAQVDSADISRNTSDLISPKIATVNLDSAEVPRDKGTGVSQNVVLCVIESEDVRQSPDVIIAGSESEKLADNADAVRETPVKSDSDQVDQDFLRDSKQGDKQNEPLDKHAVNIVECTNMQVPRVASNEREYSITPDNDTCPSPSQASDVSLGSKPKIFDEMISVKDVIVCSESSSSCTSLEMDEKIENDMQSPENCEALPRSASVQVEPSGDGVCISQPTGEVLREENAEGLVPKIRVSVEQPDALPADDPAHVETKIITEEEVTFTIDIPAESGKPLPEVNVYVSATCVAVTSTSGTVNTTSRVGGENDTTTSVSDGQALMSVGSGGDLPRATASATAGGGSGAGEAVSTHQKDEAAVNICIDRGLSSAGGLQGSAGVKRAGHEGGSGLQGREAAFTSGRDSNAHTGNIQGIPHSEATNEARNDKMELNIENQSRLVKNNDALPTTSVAGCTRSAVTEEPRSKQVELAQQHVELISCEARVNAESGRQEGKSTSISGGKHPDKRSPSNERMEVCMAERAGKAVDPISLSKPLEREPSHSTVIASREGGGYDRANVRLAVEQIAVSSASTDTASKNTLPQIAITTEISNKDALVVVENPPAESKLVGVNARDYLTVDDHLGGKGAESDSSSIGRLIHSSEGEHSDMNLDDIVVRNMDDYHNVIESRRTKHRRFDSSESSECDESDEVSSVRETDSDLSEEEENCEGKMMHSLKRPDTINDSDLSDSCDRLKAGGTKDKIEDNEQEISSGDEKPKKCITDDENHIKEEGKSLASLDDCYATKLENTGHKVGEAYFVTRRRKRAKMVDRETLTTCVGQVQVPEVRDVATDTFDSVLISSSGSSDTSPSRVQWEDDSVDELDGARYEGYSDEWYDDDEYTDDDSVYSDEDADAQLGAAAAGPVKIIYSRPRPEHALLHK